MLRHIFLLVLCLALGASALAPERALAAEDAGLASVATDGVTYRSMGAGQPRMVTPFSKLRIGDEVTIPEGGRAELVYFTSGRVEKWKGPSTIKLGADAGEGLSGAQPESATGGQSVGLAMKDLGAVMKRAEASQGGHTFVRGDEEKPPEPSTEEQAELEAYRQQYAELRKTAEESDILPEMYLATVLLAYGLEEEASSVLEDATRRCPDCETPKTLLAWVTAE